MKLNLNVYFKRRQLLRGYSIRVGYRVSLSKNFWLLYLIKINRTIGPFNEPNRLLVGRMTKQPSSQQTVGLGPLRLNNTEIVKLFALS